MKKLMIAVAIVCAAAMSQAAQIDWTLAKSSFTMADGGSDIGGVNVSLLQFATATDVQDAWTALADGTKTIADFTVIDTKSTSTASKTLGKIEAKDVVNAKLTAGAEKYYALFIEDGDKFLLSDYATGIAFDPNSEDEWKKEGTAAAFDSNHFDMSSSDQLGSWTTAAPEPTSGLLLLLGVAGLALKRKRA